jgi:transcription termination/antitermination protein NusG
VEDMTEENREEEQTTEVEETTTTASSEETSSSEATDSEVVEASPTQENTTTEETVVENSADEEADSIFAKGDGPEFQWYVAHSLTGQENKVSRALKERVMNYKLTEYFADILVPEETVQTNVNGKKRNIKRKFFPGYILIKMMMNDKTWHLVKNTDKITGFIGGTKHQPAPISEDEAAYILGNAKEGFKKVKTTVDFSEGDSVKVIEGPFASFVGVVETVSDKGKIKVNVSIFGRPTPVELDFSQIEKA